MEIKNIILINDFGYVNGGQTKVAVESALLLAESGLHVTYFAACGPMDERLHQQNIRTVCLDQKDILSNPSRLDAAVSGIWNSKAARALSALLDEFDPQDTVLHCHGFAKALSPSIWPVIGNGRFRSFYTMHEYFLACPNGGFFDYGSGRICTRKPLGVSCATTNCDPRSMPHKIWRLARQAVGVSFGGFRRQAIDLIYISDIQLRAMTPYLSTDQKLHYLPNPVDIDVGKRVDARRHNTYLFVGRLSPEKGALLLAHAAARLGVRVVFVGDGEERSKIENMSGDIEVTGWVGGDDVKKWLREARCLVFPSLWYECMPLVPLEALSLGVPVIAGQWTAGSEYVEDGISGIVLKNASTECLVSAMAEMEDSSHPVFDGVKNVKKFGMSSSEHLDGLLTIYNSK